MKFGNPSQIDLIATEVGGAIEAAPVEAQIELFDALVDGCQEATKGEIIDPKVYIHAFRLMFPLMSCGGTCSCFKSICRDLC